MSRHCSNCKHCSGAASQGFGVCDFRTLQERNRGSNATIIAWSFLDQANGVRNNAEFCPVYADKDGEESVYHAELRRRAQEAAQ